MNVLIRNPSKAKGPLKSNTTIVRDHLKGKGELKEPVRRVPSKISNPSQAYGTPQNLSSPLKTEGPLKNRGNPQKLRGP